MTGGVFRYEQLQRAALGFVLEDESWPVFLEWMRRNHASPESHAWLVAGPHVDFWRDEWAARSDNPIVRGLALRERLDHSRPRFPGGSDNEHTDDASGG